MAVSLINILVVDLLVVYRLIYLVGSICGFLFFLGYIYITRWWFEIFVVFTPGCGNDPI